MVELVLRWVKLGAGFVFFWILLWVYNARGCQRIEGKEMEPTLLAQKTQTIRPNAGRIDEIERGDIVSFSSVSAGKVKAVAARVIGLPGDRVRVEKGEVLVNGNKAGAEYVSAANKSTDDYAEIIVPRDSVFLLCDNRKAGLTLDSRAVGPVLKWALNGRF
ncbi:MAG TPA: signal peptidase I [Planctomycetota bacterium]